MALDGPPGGNPPPKPLAEQYLDVMEKLWYAHRGLAREAMELLAARAPGAAAMFDPDYVVLAEPFDSVTKLLRENGRI